MDRKSNVRGGSIAGLTLLVLALGACAVHPPAARDGRGTPALDAHPFPAQPPDSAAGGDTLAGPGADGLPLESAQDAADSTLGDAEMTPIALQPVAGGDAESLAAGARSDLLGRRIGRRFDPIYFKPGESELDNAGRRVMEQHFDWLRQNPEAGLALTGHCDDGETLRYGYALTMARALALSEFGALQGIASARLLCFAMGAEEPASQGEGEAARGLNNRAEIFGFVPVTSFAQTLTLPPADQPPAPQPPEPPRPTRFLD